MYSCTVASFILSRMSVVSSMTMFARDNCIGLDSLMDASGTAICECASIVPRLIVNCKWHPRRFTPFPGIWNVG